VTTPTDPLALLRSRAYLRLLVVAANLGVPISAAAWGFLALVSYLQKELFTHLPHALGYSTAPAALETERFPGCPPGSFGRAASACWAPARSAA
jgi:hypothetical protein